MKKITRIFNVYEGKDLIEDSKLFKKCFDKWNVELLEGWYDPIEENMINKLEKLEFYDISSAWEGFYNQGDGANIRCKITLRNALKVLKKPLSKYGIFIDLDNTTINIYHNTYHPYQHENTLCVDYNIEFYDWENQSQDTIDIISETSVNYMNEVSDEILEYIKDESRKYYNDLRKNYEFLHSEENFKNEIECYNLLFDMDGNIFFN